jgi:hypothetical protein
MPCIWIREDSAWAAYRLTDKPVELSGSKLAELPSDPEPGGATDEERATFFRVAGDGLADKWALVWGRKRSVRLNGLDLPTGVRILADRDEIKVDDNDPVVFTVETQASVESFPGSENEIRCPRCLKPIEAGSAAIRCPSCSLWFHCGEEKEKNCWAYSPECTCGRSTDMEAGFRWTPEEVWE